LLLDGVAAGGQLTFGGLERPFGSGSQLAGKKGRSPTIQFFSLARNWVAVDTYPKTVRTHPFFPEGEGAVSGNLA
jgi:hypothetical protein